MNKYQYALTAWMFVTFAIPLALAWLMMIRLSTARMIGIAGVVAIPFMLLLVNP